MRMISPFEREMTVCFTGHRDLDPADLPAISVRIQKAILDAYRSGFHVFECGGARGFDLLAAKEVLKLQNEYPDLKLWLVLPCRQHTVGWNTSLRNEYERIRAKADRIDVLSEKYYQGCMLVRDRFMVEHASLCICYLKQLHGGTLYTVSYAVRHGLETVNLAISSAPENIMKEESWNYTFTSPSVSGNADTAISRPSPALKHIYRPTYVSCSGKLKSDLMKLMKK